MKLIAGLLLGAALQAAPSALTPKEIADGWLLLFDGESTWGWTAEGGAKWRVENGSVIADSGEYGWLRSNAAFGDYELRVEFKSPSEGNSGVFLHSARTGLPHVTGYELNILLGKEVKPERKWLNTEEAKGKKIVMTGDTWHRYDVLVRGGQMEVKLDGKKVITATGKRSAFGHIGLQYNPGKAIAFRTVAVRPLGLQPIFNGKTLDGWQRVDRPEGKQGPVKEPPVWAAKNKLLHVEKGPGQLETTGVYQNFILQLDIRANSKDPARHPNSGIFLHGTPKGYWTGYEIQVRNEFKSNDPKQAVDSGTGGIYFLQPARLVVGRDNEFYTQTVLVNGRQISTWVNGYPVADLEDKNPEGTRGPRQKEALLKAGPIALQAHDPTTNLDFRNIRILPLK
ncbi:MAG: DUF1080 domain-containing protein [Acidobacteria bacterium]|nr:DUF1080 domain-containing protein [Acidobacteriota bacterium]